MKIMFYSQHVLGVGHFFRSMEIAGALHRHEVLFVEGGDPVPGFTSPGHVKRLFLPPLMMDSEFRTMETRGGSLDEIQSVRKRLLLDAWRDHAPDVLITELFPFGRGQFRFELMPLLEAVRGTRRKTKTICSLRDILVEKKDEARYEQRVLDVLNTYYDVLLVHSDPGIFSLDTTFRRVKDIAVVLRYTGFIARGNSFVGAVRQGKRIVASSGGGKVGVELLAAAIGAVQSLADKSLRLDVFIGPFMDPGHRADLEALAWKDPRTRLKPFAPDFARELAQAELSISMAGYNTCMDVLNSGVKALVYPFAANREQSLRAGRLERLNLVTVLDTLEASGVAEAIERILDGPYPPAAREIFNMNGAVETALAVENCLEQY